VYRFLFGGWVVELGGMVVYRRTEDVISALKKLRLRNKPKLESSLCLVLAIAVFVEPPLKGLCPHKVFEPLLVFWREVFTDLEAPVGFVNPCRADMLLIRVGAQWDIFSWTVVWVLDPDPFLVPMQLVAVSDPSCI
jgi:hypothetical protein